MLAAGGDFLYAQAVKMVEIEVLVADAGQELILADGLGAFGEDGAEALAGAGVDAEAGIEGIEKAGGRRRDRDGRQLVHDGADQRAEVGLEGVREVRRV